MADQRGPLCAGSHTDGTALCLVTTHGHCDLSPWSLRAHRWGGGFRAHLDRNESILCRIHWVYSPAGHQTDSSLWPLYTPSTVFKIEGKAAGNPWSVGNLGCCRQECTDLSATFFYPSSVFSHVWAHSHVHALSKRRRRCQTLRSALCL